MSQQAKSILLVASLLIFFVLAMVIVNASDDEPEEVIKIENSTQIVEDEEDDTENIHSENISLNDSSTHRVSIFGQFYKNEFYSLIESGWKEIEIQRANTALRNEELTEEEKQVFLFTNLIRLFPRKFNELYVQPLLNSDINDEYVQSLYRDLEKTPALPALYPNSILIESARYHAMDMGENNLVGHDSSDGTDEWQRIKRFGYKYESQENCHYGNCYPFDMVLSLLIDDGVIGVGHRLNILSSKFTVAGVSIQPHNSDYKINMVMDFGAK